MASARPHPLDIPEIIALVGQFIPLWSFSEDVYTRTSLIRDVFQPQDLLSAALVNRTFHLTLTPLLWQVYDDYLVYDVNRDGSINRYSDDPIHHVRIPSNILFSHCHHFRIFDNACLALIRARFPLPSQYTWFSETCTHLRELTLSKWAKDRVACQLIVKNPALRLLSWECSDKIWPVMRQRNYDALSVLHKLETLHLGRFAVDHERLCEAVLRKNAASLKELSLQGMLGFDSEEAWGPISREPHSDQEDEDEDNQSGNHQRDDESAMKVSARPGILLSNLKTLRLDCAWDEATFSLSSLGMDGFDDEGFGFPGEEDDQNSADELHDDDDEDNSFYAVIKTDNFALPGLFRCCPSLEILIWQPRKRMDMNKISRLLREYCPRLDTIRRLDGFTLFKDGLSSNEGDCILLIQGCTPPLSPQFTDSSLSTDDAAVLSGTEHDIGEQGLKHFEMGIWFLDMAITSAMLVHASSLQDIKLNLGGDEKINIENAGRLLQLCPRLKRFSIRANAYNWRPQDGLLLFQHEWGCRQLERLRLAGIADPRQGIFSVDDQDDQDEQEVQIQAQPEEQGQGHGLDQSQEQTEAFEDSGSVVSSRTTSATAVSNSKYYAFAPAHWRNVWKASFGGERKLTSASGSVFRRALFERADSMPKLVYLVLNERCYKKDEPN